MKNKLLFLLTFVCIINSQMICQIPDPCGPNPEMTSFCSTACVVCDIDGFTGVNDLTAQGQGFPEFCTFDYDNMQYIAFIAGSEDLTIRVDVGNCTGGLASLEVGFFETFDCENFDPITICDTDIISNTSQTFSTFEPLTIGQHYYLVIDGSSGANCSWTFNVIEGTTEVNPLSTSGIISYPELICPNNSVQFSTTGEVGAAYYFWTVDDIPTSSSFNQVIDLAFPEAGTYEVCVTATNACDDAPPSCVTVTVRDIGTSTIIEEICEDDCLIIGGTQYCESGVYTEVISLTEGCDSLVFIELIVNPNQETLLDVWICNDDGYIIGNTIYNETGLYTQTLQTIEDCDSVFFLDLLVIECEIDGSTSEVQVPCFGTSEGTLIFSVNQGQAPLSYTYTNISDPAITGSGTTDLLQNNEINGLIAGTYQIYITDDFGNDLVMMQEITEPSDLDLQLEASDYNGFNISCQSSNGIIGSDGIVMSNVNGGTPPYQYLWSNGSSDDMIINLEAEAYGLTVTDASGCVIESSIVLIAPDPLLADIEVYNPTCEGIELGSIVIDLVIGGVEPYSFGLSESSLGNELVFSDLPDGTYTVYVKDANGCLFSTTANIISPEVPIINLPENITLDLGDSILISPQLNDIDIFDVSWTPSDYLNCDNCLEPITSAINNTTYTLTLTSKDSCTASAVVNVLINKRRRIFYPNIFSPDGSGVNDYFFFSGGVEVETIRLFDVYDRWGNQVFSSQKSMINIETSGWDGRFNGEKVELGVYTWKAEILFIDGFSEYISGDITVVR